MRTRTPATLTILVLSGLAPIAAFAATCGDYEAQLTQEQLDYIAATSLELAVPEGEVAVVQRCDIDGNNTVDINDIRAIAMKRNQPSAHPDDPMDWDRNNWINLLDARGCQQACTLPRCAVQTGEPPAALVGGETAPAECSQTEDLNGDGEADLVAVSENTVADRGEGWTLETVILSKDQNGNVQHITYPYTGQSASATGGEVGQHVSTQPAGMVDLNPGTLMLDEPAVVAYRDGEPLVVYYFVDGVVNRAFFGIDD